MNAEVVRSWQEDGNRIVYNGALQLTWEHNLGDWLDANGVPQGTAPFASLAVVDRDARQVIQIDVTNLVVAHGADIRINRVGGTNFIFNSREAAAEADRPTLTVTRGGVNTVLQAEADMSMDGSTVNSPGKYTSLSTQYGFMIRFAQSADATIDRAVLQLVTTTTQYGNQTLQVFRPYPHPVPQNPPAMALGGSDDIVLQLQGSALYNSLSVGDRSAATLQPAGYFTEAIPTGGEVGLNSMWGIPVDKRAPEMFSRIIMRLDASFDPNWTGKMPGLANTGMVERRATQCGWGGRTADGTCWSARTFFGSAPNSTPYGASHLQFGSYAYRVNRATFNGEGPSFNYPIKRGEFFVLDQRVKMNTINADGTANVDGEMTYWLNGVPVMHWTGIQWRSNNSPDSLPSEFWGDIYVGGTGYQAPHPHGHAIYSITVSKKLLPFDASVLSTLNGQ